MAEKNQQNLVNGISQFSTANSASLQQNNMPSNSAQVLSSFPANYSSESGVLQKQNTSLVNGQTGQNNRNLNWSSQMGLPPNTMSGSLGDNFVQQQQELQQHQQQSQSMEPSTLQAQQQVQVSNVHYIAPSDSSQTNRAAQVNFQTGSYVKNSPSTNSLNQQPGVQQFSKPSVLRPTPIMGTRPPVVSNVGGQQPSLYPSKSGDGSQFQFQEQMNKQSLPAFQYSGKPSIGLSSNFTSQSYNNKLQSNPSILPCTSSPFDKPNSSIPLNSPHASPISNAQESNSSQRPNLLQANHPGHMAPSLRPQTQSQSLSKQSFHGLEPPRDSHSLLGGINQPTSFRPPISNLPVSNESKSMQNCKNYSQPMASHQTQFTGNISSSKTTGQFHHYRSVPQQQTAMHQFPPSTGHSGINNMGVNTVTQGLERMSVTQYGYNKLWGLDTVDLLQCRNILPPQKVTPPPIRLHQESMDNVNCSPEIFCCTLNKIPETNSLLQKSRLPLGILIHPFRDLSQLAVIQCSSIVRCRTCRTYINPFVYFIDNKRWKCNLCFRVNELPDEFQFDPVSKTYGDPSRRPEIRSSTIEFIASSEYMLRPPQPAIYLFVLDVSRWGCDSGYLETLCSVLLDELDNMPGDSRTQIGFILFDSSIHFFSIAETYNQAHEMVVSDLDDVFLPTPDSLLVNLNENRQLIRDLLHELPKKYAENFDTESALGPALQAAYKLMSPTGGRITVFQSCLPNKGPGALSLRDDPVQKSGKDIRHLGPQTDFYKRLSVDCSTQQISVDLFLVSSQYSDLATLGGISQFSGGCIYYFPLYRRTNLESNERLARALRRYLTRKIGFEAVMRIRCSRGLSIHTFHGNFFVRSTDMLSLPNVNPDAGFGMQIAIEDSLYELQCVCFQAAVLYTSAKGERRIRVHTLCLPVSSNLSDILTSADQQAIIGLLSKMAVDRSLKSNLSDAREAFINVAIDILSAFKLVETSGGQNALLAPTNLSLIPLYILALLKWTAFRTGQETRLDDRLYAMLQLKTLPLRELIQSVHPDLYHITHLNDETGIEFEDKLVAQPARLSLSSEHLDSRGAFLLDTPEIIYLIIGKNISIEFLVNVFDVKEIRQINKDTVDLPELDNDFSEKLRHFINFLQAEKPWPAVIKVVIEPNTLTSFFIQDKTENALSYYELLHHVKAQLK